MKTTSPSVVEFRAKILMGAKLFKQTKFEVLDETHHPNIEQKQLQFDRLITQFEVLSKNGLDDPEKGAKHDEQPDLTA